MKKIYTLMLTGSLLIAGAVSSPASAHNCWGNNHHNHGWQKKVNKMNRRYANQVYNNRFNYGNPYYGSWNNGYYNNYRNGYCNTNPGLFTRMINRIF